MQKGNNRVSRVLICLFVFTCSQGDTEGGHAESFPTADSCGYAHPQQQRNHSPGLEAPEHSSVVCRPQEV